jgi:LCP family protein required for cell wall assembly
VGVAGIAGYAVSCIVAAAILVVSGFAYYVKAQVTSIGGSNAISGGPVSGAMNILLMGLESRTDYDGNILPASLLKALHAGSVQGVKNGVGGQDTNTLILIHIFAGGQKAVGFSIPRDDWVTYPKAYDGQSQGKIDQAYGLAWAQSLSQTNNSNMAKNQRYLLANEAGQTAAIDSVQALTGVHVDHFAEVNLAGFYELAQTFGGIEACLKSWKNGQNLHDANSGFDAPHAGYLHLDAAQALAFVRERDNLPNGDLDRTHRQQAVLDYVIWKLGHQGIFTSIDDLTRLVNEAKKFVITDSDWQIFNFATEMKSLTGKNLTFQTAPVVSTNGMEGGQTVNIIDPAAIKQVVQHAFYPAPATTQPTAAAKSLAPSATAVDVLNGGAAAGLAAQMSQALTSAGFKAGKVGNTTPGSSTQVLYGPGAAASAAKVAGYFNGVTATASTSVAAGHVELVLGPDATSVPATITAGSATAAPSVSPSGASQSGASQSGASQSGASQSGGSQSGAPSASPTSSSNNGQAGGAVTVAPSAPYGIPCVY